MRHTDGVKTTGTPKGSLAKHQPLGIDRLPTKLRDECIDKLLTGSSCRQVAQYIADSKTGFTLSAVAVATFRRKVILPQLQAASKLLELSHTDKPPIEKAKDRNDLTRTAIKGNHVLKRINRKYERYDAAIPKALSENDFQSFASMDRAETATLTLDARIHGLITENPQNVNVQVVIGQRPANSTQPKSEELEEEIVTMAVPSTR